MTPSRVALAGPAAAAMAPVAPPRRGPVIVLSYVYAGVQQLQSLLGEHPQLVCTTGTGLLPLCAQAALTWQQAEGRAADPGPPSALARASIRALTGSIAASLLAREGKARWCEIATAPAAYAETFLRVYPDAQFLCLHRNCADVIRSAVRANPWGISDTELGRFAAAYPGRSAAIVAAYWCAHTGPMLDFEAAHPDACSQVRYEDLSGDPDSAAREIFTFLDLDCGPRKPDWMKDNPQTGGGAFPAPPVPIPADQLPPSLRTQADSLLTRLSYPPLA
jgi:protein-tyrosine sulfotransferase